ncbi:retroviral-like aspartic protease family protein [Undibacterium sp. JH2W]|uniref:retroviral-like aspartic protease family protein n=1 Tax=Undibacterium sp. JH2W TaxID=3413037 RepID=UPI003BF15C37
MLTQLKTLFAASLLLCLPALAETYPPSAYKEGAIKCMRARSYDCAEKNWNQYIKMRPTDAHAVASLAIVYHWADKPEASIIQSEKAISMGEGTYDLFAAYSESLAKTGRIDEAIDWGYKTLAVVPTLVNVRGDVAKYLVLRKREFEALALLASFDASLEAQGHGHYFEGQRIAIESSLERQGQAVASTQKSIRLPRTKEHFYAPVKLGDSRIVAFMVDTGATKTSLSEDMLTSSKATYKVVKPNVNLQLADGRNVSGRMVTLDAMKVGPFELHKVTAFVCKTCVSLLGQASLSQFNMVSSKIQGVEFLTLELR